MLIRSAVGEGRGLLSHLEPLGLGVRASSLGSVHPLSQALHFPTFPSHILNLFFFFLNVSPTPLTEPFPRLVLHEATIE